MNSASSHPTRVIARNRIAVWLTAAFFVWPLAAQAAEVAPDVLARNTTDEVARIVSEDKEIKAGNRDKINQLVETKVVPYFDFKEMAQLAVGKHWSKATPEQREKIVDEFRTLLVRTYAGAIASIAEYKINFKPQRMQPNDNEVTVRSEVLKPGAPPITLDYRMKKQDGSWKVFDVLVDQASLVTTYRGSFNSNVRKGGIDGLIAALVSRNRGNSAEKK